MSYSGCVTKFVIRHQIHLTICTICTSCRSSLSLENSSDSYSLFLFAFVYHLSSSQVHPQRHRERKQPLTFRELEGEEEFLENINIEQTTPSPTTKERVSFGRTDDQVSLTEQAKSFIIVVSESEVVGSLPMLSQPQQQQRPIRPKPMASCRSLDMSNLVEKL